MARRPTDTSTRIIDAAMRLAAERGWRDLSLNDIAQAAKLPLSKVYEIYPSKRSILAGFSRMIDGRVLAEEEAAAELEPARDRLFDVLMRRFDALQPYREGIGAVLYDLPRQPLALCGGVRQLKRSMGWMLEAAGLSSTGPRGAVRVRGLAAVYLATLRVWLRDDSADMAKTMAALDGYLRRIEAIARRFSGRRWEPGEAGEAPGAAR